MTESTRGRPTAAWTAALRVGSSEPRRPSAPPFRRCLDLDAEEQRRVEQIVGRLGPRDRRAAAIIVRRVSEVAAQQGQAAALRLVDEIIGIVSGPAELEH